MDLPLDLANKLVQAIFWRILKNWLCVFNVRQSISFGGVLMLESFNIVLVGIGVVLVSGSSLASFGCALLCHEILEPIGDPDIEK